MEKEIKEYKIISKKPKGKPNKSDISLIALKLLECLKENPNNPITYETLHRKLRIVLPISPPDEKNRRIRNAIDLLIKAGYNIEKIIEKGKKYPKAFKYISNNVENVSESMLIYSFVKSGILKKDYYESNTTNMNRYLKYSKHIVYTDNYNKIDEYEISNINTIIKAIENEKYIKFQRVYKTTKKNDIIYKPLGILVDNEMLYLAFIFQPQINKVHVLDFIPIKSIHNIEVIENKIYNYVNLKNLYKKDFPLYADFYQELFEDGNIEVLVDIYEKKMYYKHSCEIKYYNESFIEELESICIDIDTEYREEENYTKYFSYIYYENEENLFEWIYSKKKEKEKIKEYYNEIMEDYIEEKQQLQTESNHKQKLHSIEFSNNKVRERYVKYEIKRDTQS